MEFGQRCDRKLLLLVWRPVWKAPGTGLGSCSWRPLLLVAAGNEIGLRRSGELLLLVVARTKNTAATINR